MSWVGRWVKRIGITEILGRIWPFSANKIKKKSESVSKQPTQLIIATHNCHKCYPFRKYPTNEDILDPAFIRTSVLYTWVFEENNVLCGITLNQVILSHWMFVNYPSYFTWNFGFWSFFWPKMPNSQSDLKKPEKQLG